MNESQVAWQNPYSLGEEVANSIIHGLGVLLSVAGFTLLLTFAAIEGDIWRIVSFSVYGATLVFLFLASTLYHSLPGEKAKRIFRMIDHCAIFLFIAGSYTPFMLVKLRDGSGWWLFGLAWGLAALGITQKLVFRHRFAKLSLATYLVMGWMIVVASSELVQALDTGGVAWLISGGLSYTVGVFFYVRKTMPYHHAIWHIFVLAGSICHYFAILFYVLPMPAS
jgi:hemolysin III